MVCKAYKYCVDNIGLFGEQTGERCSPLPPFVRLMHKVSERCLFFYAKKPWREMPVTASYQSCFFDVFSQRKQKNHAPQKKDVIWVQGHAPAVLLIPNGCSVQTSNFTLPINLRYTYLSFCSTLFPRSQYNP